MEHGKRICKHSPSISEESIKEELCRRLEMGSYDEWMVAGTIDTILIQGDGVLKIEYKRQEFSQTMRD